MANLFAKIFKSPSRKGAQQNPADAIRKLEMQMRTRLELIRSETLSDPHRRLSAEKEKALNISGVIDYALRQLRYPLVSEQDINHLDSHLAYIIAVLNDAIRNGFEMTAEWACTALVFAIKNMRIDIPDTDKPLADALMASRIEYSKNLKLLVELCREHDHISINLAEQTCRRQQKRDQLEAEKLRYKARLDAGELDMILDELQMFLHEPSKLSDTALELRDDLANMHLLQASITEIDTAIKASQAYLDTCQAKIDRCRNGLSNPPYVTATGMDPFTALDADQRDALRKLIEIHSHPEKMSFEELTNLDNL